MARNYGELEDRDLIACWVLASTENGLDEVEFERLIETRKQQKHLELVQLSEDLETLVSKRDFEKMGRVFLTAQEHGCSMREAEEIITKLDEERTKEDTSSYGKITKAMRTPKYSTTEKPQREETQKEEDVETTEWVRSGTVKLEQLKKKYRR